MNKPKVSIVMAVYNEFEHIGEAINSIQAQTFEDWEFIIVDDHSTDGTRQIIEHFAKMDERIKLLLNERNMGLAASLNRGIDVARGKYIARMDADDISLERRLSDQVEYLDNHPKVAVVGANVKFISPTGKVLGVSNMPLSHNDINLQIAKKNPIVHPVVMFRREFIEAMNGYDKSLRKKQDYDLWVRGVNNFNYANLSKILLNYRVEYSKSISTDLYGFYVRLRNSIRLKRASALGWAFIVLSVSMLQKFGYKQRSYRKQV